VTVFPSEIRPLRSAPSGNPGSGQGDAENKDNYDMFIQFKTKSIQYITLIQITFKFKIYR